MALRSALGDQAAPLVAVTKDLTVKFQAGDIVQQVAPIIGGSGGGRPDFAQAGGTRPDKLDEAFDRIGALLGSCS